MTRFFYKVMFLQNLNIKHGAVFRVQPNDKQNLEQSREHTFALAQTMLFKVNISMHTYYLEYILRFVS